MQIEGTILQDQLIDVMKQLSIIKFIYSRMDYAKLDTNWNTDNFPIENRITSRSRIYFPIDGEGYGRMKNRTLVFRPGFIYLIPPFTNLHVSCDRFLVKYYVHFNAMIPDLNMDVFSFLQCPYELPVENRELLIAAFEILLKNVKPLILRKKTLSEIDRLEAHAAMSLLVMPFLRSAEKNLQLKSYDDNRIIKMQHFIETHLDCPNLLKRLAQEFQLNPNYLSNFYKEKMGLPLAQYINSRRLSKAASYLAFEKTQIKEIAWRMGYNEPRSFARFFRKMTGFSPESYRQKFKPNQPPV